MTTTVVFYRAVRRRAGAGRRAYLLVTCAGYQFPFVTEDPLTPDDVLSFWRANAAPDTLWDEFAVYHFDDTWGYLNSAGFRRLPDAHNLLTLAIRRHMLHDYKQPYIIDADQPGHSRFAETMPDSLLQKYGSGTPPVSADWPGF